jgi:HD-like signal output (HDOD) protein
MRGGTFSQRRPDHGRGVHEIDASEYMLSPQAMVAHLRQTLTSKKYTPPLLPSIALELMKLTRQPEVKPVEVRQLLERDPLLCAKVLQLSQSALYSRGTPVRSVQEAISLLGVRTLGDLFLQTVLSTRVFRADGYDAPMASLMRHSMLTAHIARLACRMTSIPDEYAFMCGLLHDVGIAAGLLIFADAFSKRPSSRDRPLAGPPVTPSPAPRSGPPAFEEVVVALHAVHEEASAVLAEAWQLSPDIRVVLGLHHQLKMGERIHPLAAVVCVSDWVASEVGAGIEGESDAMRADDAARSLGFSKTTLEELTGRARQLLELL